jgi:parallel beta-helix repeat protein
MARSPKLASLIFGSALLAAAGTGILSAAPPASATTSVPNLYVATTGSDSGNTCRLFSHPCATISYALTQAPAGAEIHVSAGTFTTPVQVTQNVTILGTQVHGVARTIINPGSTVSDTDPNNFEGLTTDSVLVDVTNGATAHLSNLIISGINVGPSFTSCGTSNFVGLYFHNASGTASNVTVTQVQEVGAFGCQGGDGVYVTTDSGPASHVTFTQGKVTFYDKNGITCRYAGTVCNINNSTVTGIGATGAIAQNGIEIAFGGPSASVVDDTVTANSYTGGGAGNAASGVLIYDAAATTVAHDAVKGNDVNISASADSGQVAGAWNISNNLVGGATDNITASAGGPVVGNQYGDGIQLYGVNSTWNPTLVADNTSDGDYEYGVSLFGTTGATVSQNVLNKDYDGIFVDSTSSHNSFTGNSASTNLHYDYEDTSTGSGDQGTNDLWLPASTHGTANTCTPALDSAPEGLC